MKPARRMKRWLLPAVFLLVGLFLLHGPMLRDGLGRVHGNMVDGRLVALLLEHAHRWLAGTAPSLFSPSWMFYPYPNALTLTDTLLGGTLLYSPLRWLGLPPLHAFQAWIVLAAALGFGAVHRLASRLGMSPLAACLAAFVVTFGMPRVSAAHHPQLAFFLPVPLVLLALLSAFEAKTRTRRMLLVLTAALALAWQFWVAAYLGLFALLALGVTAVTSIAFRDSRRVLLGKLAADKSFNLAVALAAAALFAICMAPLVRASAVHGDLLRRPWQEVATYLPTAAALVFPHGGSPLYGWAHGLLAPFVNNTSESQLFAGFAALMAPVGVAILVRRAPHAINRALAVVLLVVWGALTILMLGDRSGHSLWRLVHALPGGQSIRAVGRLGFFTLFCGALMLGQVVTWLELRVHRRWLIALAAFVIAENAIDNRYLFSVAAHDQRIAAVTEELARRTPCPAFIIPTEQDDFRAYAVQLDAMWASAETGIPTLNGWAGAAPPGWSFRGRPLLRAQALDWARHYRPDLADVCVLAAPGVTKTDP